MTIDSTTRTADYTAVLDLPADPAAVAALLASADGISRWWGPTEGDASAGGTFVTSFGDYGVNANHVREVGPDRVVWEPTSVPSTRPTDHTGEWQGTTIEFDLAPSDAGTQLHFRHVGLTPQLVCWDGCYDGWNYFLSSIQTWAETGTGTPFGS
jgi:uncharacterized protein YndB with AHSA1/START domain